MFFSKFFLFLKLVNAKCFITGYTALHWAVKHGNQMLVTLLAGTYGADVNSLTHGGYTPCHIACQFGRNQLYDVLVEVYGANPDIYDNAGKKPKYYLLNNSTVIPRLTRFLGRNPCYANSI